MNQHLHSPDKLTEFARDFEDEPETIFGRFVNKLQSAYNHSYNTVNDINNITQQQQVQTSKSIFYATENTENVGISENAEISRNSSTNSLPNQSNSTSPSIISTSELSTQPNTPNAPITPITAESNNEGRTMLSVLKRISNIMSSKNNDLRNYKDTDLHRFWMPDSKAKECYDCSQKFSTFRRKHHCRLCGQIFCSKCCNQVVPGKIIMCAGDLKVCNYCSKIVLSYLKSPNITVDLHSDLQALQQDLSSKLEDNEETAVPNKATNRPTLARKISVGYQEERFATHQQNLSFDDRKSILQQSNSLIALHEEMQRALPAQNCGLDLIEFLNSNQKSWNKVQAIAILSAMLAAGFLQPIVPDSEETAFDETLHYCFVKLPSRQPLETIFYQELTMDSPKSSYDDAQTPKFMETSTSLQSMQELELENSMRSTAVSSKLLEAYCDHEDQLLMQMLRSYHLDWRWAQVLQPLCCRAANHFKPEFCTNDLMDIRNYVNFKKVPGGKRHECTLVGGVVFSKNVAHKEMPTRVEHPRILLLQCPIVYERVEGKFVSIQTVLLQEKEYLRNVCARIMTFKPNVVLVHKNVAGVAQDMLRSHDITLVLDVKLSVMERLARTLQCDIITSIESNIAKPKLGVCDAFYIRSFDDGSGISKNLMFFEKLTTPSGYTCLLRGGNNKELAKVKKVASFLVYARYNWRLEMSFLLDAFAEPLSPKRPIFDSKESSPKDENASNNNQSIEEEQLLRSTQCKRPLERKSEDKIHSAIAENVADFTDPLRSTEPSAIAHSPDSSIVELAVEMRYDNRFRNALSSTILSISPFLSFPLPYLETEQGRKCPLRSLFPAELYFSKLWSGNSNTMTTNNNNNISESTEIKKQKQNGVKLNPPHAFLQMKITTPVEDRKLQTLLAEFRAFGGRFPKNKKLFKQRPVYQEPQKITEEHVFKDALDLNNHQRMPVLFCSFYFSSKAPASFCAPPTLLDMKFYGQQDIMLGQFLQRYCCRLNSICTVCNLPMLGHVRRYVHSNGCVQVMLEEDKTRMDPNRIYFKAWCSICNEGIPCTPCVPLSETSKCLSFAKYLELRFHGHAYKTRLLHDAEQLKPKCAHSLQRDYVHYFTYRGVGAEFRYTCIDMWEITLPPLVLMLQSPKTMDRFIVLEDLKNFSMKGHEVYTRIHERIADLALEDESSPLVASSNSLLHKDQFNFKQQLEIVQTLLTETKANAYDINDALLMAKRVLAESIELWTPRLHEMLLAQKMAAKQQQQQQHVDAGTICTEDLQTDNAVLGADMQRQWSATQTDATNLAAEQAHDELSSTSSTHNIAEKKSSLDLLLNAGNSSDKKSIKKMLTQLLPSNSQANLLQTPFNAQEHLTLPLGAFPVLVHDQDPSSIIAYALLSTDYQRAVSALDAISSGNVLNVPVNASTNAMPSPNFVRKSQEHTATVGNNDNNEEPNKTSNARVSNSNSSIAGNNSTNADDASPRQRNNNSHIELTFQDNSTQFSCKIYFAKEFDLVRSKTLKIPRLGKSLYKEHEHNKKREELKVSQSKSGTEMALVRKPSDAGVESQSKADGSVVQRHNAVDDCRYFLARSLSSSVQWEAKGGKSGSRFCKTLDDRFVLKEMSKFEVAIFENFAPNYFDYLIKCQQQNKPTLLAKIFGVFKVTIKKKDFFQEKTLLVMENLFYNCDIKNKFDLKGSERNRHVDPTNANGEIVLLDENLMEMSWSKPLYILSHSKAVLRDTINRDSSFLEKNEVMDYSLLAGLNDKNGTLVLGIIDYIRTFTFDKKVESIIKGTGILGGMGKSPTVISPERYKQRFIDAMDRYFYTVPDRWEGLSKI